MFSLVAIISLATLVLGLPANDLKVSLTPLSPLVDSLDDIGISATVFNPTDKDIRVLSINNVLDPSSTQSFRITRDSPVSKEVTFTGIMAIYDMSAESIYTTIPAYSSVTVNHTALGSLYDFSPHGSGKFSFAALAPLGPSKDGLRKTFGVVNSPVIIEVTRHAVVHRRAVLSHATSVPSQLCLDAIKFQVIQASLVDARALAAATVEYIRNNPGSDAFVDYFKGNLESEISNRIDLIAKDQGTRVVGCIDIAFPRQCNSNRGVIAYTFPIQPRNIVVCDIFFTRARLTPSVCGTSGYSDTLSSQGGIILHELSHAYSLTHDPAYGCDSLKNIPKETSLDNADSYRCLSLAVYAKTKC